MQKYIEPDECVEEMLKYRHGVSDWKDLNGDYDDYKVKNMVTSAVSHCILIVQTAKRVDAEPVLRCPDCVNCQQTAVMWCMYHDTSVTSRGFCSWGRRKENG